MSFNKMLLDKNKADCMLFNLFYSTDMINELPALIGEEITDEEWSMIIDTIELIIDRKQKRLCVGRPIRFKRVLV